MPRACAGCEPVVWVRQSPRLAFWDLNDSVAVAERLPGTEVLLKAEQDRMPPAEAEQLLSSDDLYASPFLAMPF